MTTLYMACGGVYTHRNNGVHRQNGPKNDELISRCVVVIRSGQEISGVEQ